MFVIVYYNAFSCSSINKLMIMMTISNYKRVLKCHQIYLSILHFCFSLNHWYPSFLFCFDWVICHVICHSKFLQVEIFTMNTSVRFSTYSCNKCHEEHNVSKIRSCIRLWLDMIRTQDQQQWRGQSSSYRSFPFARSYSLEPINLMYVIYKIWHVSATL